LHKYLYADANPVNMRDMSGHEGSLLEAIAVPTIGAAIGAWSSAAANYAQGKSQTYGSILEGMAWGAALPYLFEMAPALAPVAAGYGLATSGELAMHTMQDPNATTGQRVAAWGLFLGAVFGANKAMEILPDPEMLPPVEPVKPQLVAEGGTASSGRWKLKPDADYLNLLKRLAEIRKRIPNDKITTKHFRYTRPSGYQRFGWYETEADEITFYQDYGIDTIAEELFHWERAHEMSHAGHPMDTAVENDLETDVIEKMAPWFEEDN